MYAHKGGSKKLKRHGLHGFALDQPSINGIGLINRSEKMKRSGRKQLKTVGNMIRPKLVQPAFFKKRAYVFKKEHMFARQKSSCFVAYVHEKYLKIW